MDLSRRKPVMENRVPGHVEKAVIGLVIDIPALGSMDIHRELMMAELRLIMAA